MEILLNLKLEVIITRILKQVKKLFLCKCKNENFYTSLSIDLEDILVTLQDIT